MSQITIKVRSHLQTLDIKLWLEPYYSETDGTNETAINELAKDFSKNLGLSVSSCKLSLIELQNGALRKLAARKEFENSGVATLNIRRIKNSQGSCNISEVKCSLTILGSELLQIIGKSLDIDQPDRIKCIVAGRTLNAHQTLLMQNIKNNQQLMVIVSELAEEQQKQHTSENVMLDRIEKIRQDIEMIVDSNQQLFEMEDQDGNPIFVPPDENRALLMALGFYEKARAALNSECYDEALILLLEADEKFRSCNSKLLEMVDNYGLVNLDIVWCYLCLKNITQLPDAQRRLEICEKSFQRSYGERLERLITLKGKGCSERGLIMRLHLLQGVVLYHKNRPNEAYEKLIEAENELVELKVNEDSMQTLIDMGFETYEARLGLRACQGKIEEAVAYIHDWKEQRKQNRKRAAEQRKLNDELAQMRDASWVNPRSVCTLTEMGFLRDLVVYALKLSDNNLTKALDLLQNHSEQLNFNAVSADGPSTSFSPNRQIDELARNVENQRQSLLAYQRFREGLNGNAFDYLDLPLILEEQILLEYKQLLE